MQVFFCKKPERGRTGSAQAAVNTPVFPCIESLVKPFKFAGSPSDENRLVGAVHRQLRAGKAGQPLPPPLPNAGVIGTVQISASDSRDEVVRQLYQRSRGQSYAVAP